MPTPQAWRQHFDQLMAAAAGLLPALRPNSPAHAAAWDAANAHLQTASGLAQAGHLQGAAWQAAAALPYAASAAAPH